MLKPKYRNKFEAHAAQVLGDLCEYESKKVPYVTHRNYIPDFTGPHTVSGIEILVEAKGYFRVGDIQKYKAIRDCLNTHEQELVFLLYNPTKRVRKGGKLNMKQWCEKEGLRSYTLEDITDAFTT